jgi:hypothetical protein
MTRIDHKKLIKVLGVLLNIEDIEIIKYTIESIIEELEDESNKDSKGDA